MSKRIFMAAYHTLFYISEAYAQKGELIMSTFSEKNVTGSVIGASVIPIELLRFQTGKKLELYSPSFPLLNQK